MSTAKRIFKNISYLAVGDVCGSLLQFLFILYLGKEFGEEGVGKYSFAFSFIMVFAIFSDLGMGPFLIREVAREKQRRELVIQALLFRVLSICSLILFVCTLIYVFQDSFEREKILIIGLLGLYQIFYGVSDIFIAELKAHERMKSVAFLGVFLKVIVVAIGIILLYAEFELVEVLAVFPIGAFIYLIATFSYSVYTLGMLRFRFEYCSSLISFIWQLLPFSVSVILMELLGRQEILFLSFYHGDQAVGVYTIALKIATVVVAFSILFEASVLPTLSRYFLISHQQMLNISQKLLKYCILLSMPISVGLYSLSERIILFLYQDSFGESVLVLRILGWVVFFALTKATFSTLLTAVDRQKDKAICIVITLVMSFILNLIFIPKYSYLGAAYIRLFIEFFPFILFALITYNALSFCPKADFIRPTIACSGMAIFIHFMSSMHIVFMIPLSAIVYFISLIAVGGLNQEDLVIMKEVLTGEKR